jgi:hypothetical protein
MISRLKLKVAPAHRARIFGYRLAEPLHNTLYVKSMPTSAESDRRIIAWPFLPRCRHLERILADSTNIFILYVPIPGCHRFPGQNLHSHSLVFHAPNSKRLKKLLKKDPIMFVSRPSSEVLTEERAETREF